MQTRGNAVKSPCRRAETPEDVGRALIHTGDSVKNSVRAFLGAGMALMRPAKGLVGIVQAWFGIGKRLSVTEEAFPGIGETLIGSDGSLIRIGESFYDIGKPSIRCGESPYHIGKRLYNPGLASAGLAKVCTISAEGVPITGRDKPNHGKVQPIWIRPPPNRGNQWLGWFPRSPSLQARRQWFEACSSDEARDRTFSEKDDRAVGKEKVEFADVRWTETTSVLRRESANGTKPVKQIEFAGERLDMSSVRRWRERVLKADRANY